MSKKIEETFKQENKKLQNFIKSKIDKLEDAEDIFQDVFYQAVINANVLESVDNIIGWIYTVAKNKIIDFYRKKRLKTIPINGNEDEYSLEEFIEDSFSDVEDEYTKKIMYEELLKAIDELPDEQKKIFIANEFDNISFKELSEKNGISINTLLSRKRYAVAYLKERLKSLWDN